MKHTNPKIALIEKDPFVSRTLEMFLKGTQVEDIIICADETEFRSVLTNSRFDIVIADINAFSKGEEGFLKKVHEHDRKTRVVFTVGIDDVGRAVDSIKLGAREYIVKPVSRERFLNVINEVLPEVSDKKEEVAVVQDEFSDIVTADKKIRSIFRYMNAIKKSPEPVLVTGETGVGKDLIARAVHKVSKLDGEFVAVNVAGLDDHMFTDTLFGHLRGAFTGADKKRAGLIEKAKGGTLFLDEIGDLSHASQVKLLELLQSGTYYPIGSDSQKTSDARIVVATNRDLYEMQSKGEFRKDLYYRLSVHHIDIPPLRKRTDDIPVLFEHFLEMAATAQSMRKPTYVADLIPALKKHFFPGNVRELRAMVFNAVSSAGGNVLSAASFPELTQKIEPSTVTFETIDKSKTLKNLFGKVPSMAELEIQAIKEALEECKGNRTHAAAMLGITRQTLIRKLKQD